MILYDFIPSCNSEIKKNNGRITLNNREINEDISNIISIFLFIFCFTNKIETF